MNTERNNPNAKPKQFFQAKKAEGVKKRAVGSVLAEGKACQQKSRPGSGSVSISTGTVLGCES